MSESIAANRNRALQKRAVRHDGWTRARRQLFLDTLAGTCNVRIAIAATGLSVSTAYQLRRRDPAFAELWKEALTIGYERLEEALLQRALEGVNAIEIDAEAPMVLPHAAAGAGEREGADGAAAAKAFQPGSGAGAGSKPGAPDVQLALLLLNRHRASVEGNGPGSGTRKRASSEETDAALRVKLDRLARQLGAKP